MTEDLTPIRSQYLEIKKKYPKAILLFRLGDFYETFDEDAEITSRELDIVLTSRPIGKGIRAPLAGIPYHAIDNYLSRLVEKGYHVAICEQIGEQPAKGIFPRQVVRVITPGTLIEQNLLQPTSNNYLLSIYMDDNRAGICYSDISTGDLAVTEMNISDPNAFKAELARLSPSEIILSEKQKLPFETTYHLTYWNNWHFDQGRCQEIILSQFSILSLASLGIENKSLATLALGSLLQYLKENSPTALLNLKNLHSYNVADFMVLDSPTRRNLEIIGSLKGEKSNSLLGVIDKTLTPMGGRLIRQWINQPLIKSEFINQRLDGVGIFLASSMLRNEIRSVLRNVHDLERTISRIQSNNAQPRDLVSLREGLTFLKPIEQILIKYNVLDKKEVVQFKFQDCAEELSFLQLCLTEDPPATLQNIGIIQSGFSSELDDIVAASKNARDWINNFETSERKRSGIKSLKVSFNKIFGYFIEISHANKDQVPENYIRKQTLVNAERYITSELKEYEILVLNAEENIHNIELRLFKEICAKLSKSTEKILIASETLAKIDVLSSLAETASLENYVRPQVVEEKELAINNGRHPVVERFSNHQFTPNDVIFEQNESVRIITGPNMSGKSTYLRQTALIVLMAQMGSYVPATSARIGIVDRIFTRIGAQDEIQSGHSTFMVEMIETSNILHNATDRSLLILDEIGRGTSTYDGVSIAWAVIEYIHNHPKLKCLTLFATHYHELTQLANQLPGIRNYNVAVTESNGNILFLHKIIPGGADRSYGIHVAQLAGLPGPVLQRATEIMHQLEISSGNTNEFKNFMAQQISLFPEHNPLIDEISEIDLNSLSPIEALNKIYEWQNKIKNRN